MNKAFEVTYPWDSPGTRDIYAGASAGQVRYRIWSRARRYWGSVRFDDIKVRRAPRFDALAVTTESVTHLGYERPLSLTGGTDYWGCLSR